MANYPKPTALKLLEGNAGKRAVNEAEPKPTITTEPPAWLEPRAAKYWQLLAPKLALLGILSEIDTEAFARYCDGVGIWIELSKFVNKNGTAYAIPAIPPDPKTGSKGRPAKVEAYPQARQYKEYSEMLLRFEMQFGMTPSVRSRLKVDSPELRIRGFGTEDDDLNS